MSTTPEGGEAKRRPVMAFVAYGVVLVLLGWAGAALWTAGSGGRPDLAGSRRAVPVAAKTEPPASPMVAAETAPVRQEPQRETAVVSPSPPSPASSPPQGEASDKTPPVPPSPKPEPALAKCTLDSASWPTDRTEQAKAIQILLRDLGFYGGTTYGTLGPTTRAAIRKFQVAAGEAETGEPSEMLFESLRKKCAP
jgi:hypothetical protein